MDFDSVVLDRQPVVVPQARRSWILAILREPLLHFMLIGAAIFAISHFADTTGNTAKIIRVTPELRQQLTEEFTSLQGRAPTEDEYQRVSLNWVRNEILFREAMALKLDAGDDMIRERVAQKMRLLVFGRITVPAPTDSELRAWFESRRATYDTPIRYDFFEVAVPGENAEKTARGYLADIAAGHEPEELRVRARVFAGRSPAVLASVFGAPFADAIAAMPIRTWQAVNSTVGWHLIRIDAVHPGQPADFEMLRSNLEQTWSEERRRQIAVRAVNELEAVYKIQREDLP